MNVSLNWLNELLHARLTVSRVTELFSQAGLPVDSARRLDADFDNVVVGEILAIAPHPNADRLRIVDVRTGLKHTRRLVCGAPNVAVGQKVPVALPGSRLAKGRILQAAAIRGVQSDGMICAPDELGLGKDHAGIMVLDPKAAVGRPLSAALGLDDVSLDIEVTPNRADCMSAVGLARELASGQGKAFRAPTVKLRESGAKPVRVNIRAATACPKYSARLVTNVKQNPTPAWLQARLLASGIRPINLVVDVTNYVMLEFGQPLHAFDAAKVMKRTLEVRFAKSGEQLKTLDNVVRKLDPSMLVIAGVDRVLALAGVMGGLDSEVTAGTKDVLLESAVFAPRVIRKTARSLHLLSEASQRFERGIDQGQTEPALDRAAQLLVELGQGKLDGRKTVVGARAPKPKAIVVPLDRVNSLLNTKFARPAIARMLTRLGCTVRGTAKILSVTPPPWRVDLNLVEDIIEEIARLHGYQNLEPTRLTAVLRPAPIDPLQRLEERSKDILVGLGYSETYTRATESTDRPDAAPDSWRIANPLDPKDAVLRRSLIANLESVARNNLERTADRTLGVFEIGTVFSREAGLPKEGRVCGGTYWTMDSGKTWPGRIIKGHIAYLFRRLGLREPKFAAGRIMIDSEPVGRWLTGEAVLMGRNRYVRESWEVVLNRLIDKRESHKFTFDQYPPVKRDVALWVPPDLNADALFAAIRKASPLVVEVEPFDLFEKDKRQSVALHLTFQAPDRTLNAPEVEAALRTIIASLTQSLHISIRS